MYVETIHVSIIFWPDKAVPYFILGPKVLPNSIMVMLIYYVEPAGMSS